MKNSLVSFASAAALVFVTFSSLVVPQTAFALDESSDSSSRGEICIRKPSEIARYPEVAQAVAGFGGLERLEGDWKMGGLISMFAKVQVGLSHTRSAFSVEIDKKYSKPFYICVNESRPDLLTLKIQQAENPSFSKIILKPGRSGETLYVGAAKTKWKFIKFNRN